MSTIDQLANIAIRLAPRTKRKLKRFAAAFFEYHKQGLTYCAHETIHNTQVINAYEDARIELMNDPTMVKSGASLFLDWRHAMDRINEGNLSSAEIHDIVQGIKESEWRLFELGSSLE